MKSEDTPPSNLAFTCLLFARASAAALPLPGAGVSVAPGASPPREALHLECVSG